MFRETKEEFYKNGFVILENIINDDLINK